MDYSAANHSLWGIFIWLGMVAFANAVYQFFYRKRRSHLSQRPGCSILLPASFLAAAALATIQVGNHISRSQVSEMTQGLNEQAEEFRNRPLTSNAYPVLWVDAEHPGACAT